MDQYERWDVHQYITRYITWRPKFWLPSRGRETKAWYCGNVSYWSRVCSKKGIGRDLMFYLHCFWTPGSFWENEFRLIPKIIEGRTRSNYPIEASPFKRPRGLKKQKVCVKVSEYGTCGFLSQWFAFLVSTETDTLGVWSHFHSMDDFLNQNETKLFCGDGWDFGILRTQLCQNQNQNNTGRREMGFHTLCLLRLHNS